MTRSRLTQRDLHVIHSAFADLPIAIEEDDYAFGSQDIEEVCESLIKRYKREGLELSVFPDDKNPYKTQEDQTHDTPSRQ